MFTGLLTPLAEGDQVRVTLEFEIAGPLDVVIPVGPVGATGHHGKKR